MADNDGSKLHEDGDWQFKCSSCGEWNYDADWTYSEVGCEDCGSHDARGCPHCGEVFDLNYWHPESRILDREPPTVA